MLEAVKPSVKAENRGPAWLLSALVVLTGFLGALGISSGALHDMARSHRIATITAFACVASAVIAGAIGAYVSKEVAKERRWFYLGVLLLWFGLLAAIYGGTSTWGDTAEPSLAAKIEEKGGRRFLDVSVKDSGLASKKRVVVSAVPIYYDYKSKNYFPGRSLYAASLGPDGSGTIDHSARIPLPPGSYGDVEVKAWLGEKPDDCWGKRVTTGCVAVRLLRIRERPQLRLRWGGMPSALRLVLSVEAHDIPTASVRVRVTGRTSTGAKSQLAAWVLAPDGNGNFNRSLAVWVKRRIASVCIVATTGESLPAECSSASQRDTVWADLATPARAAEKADD